MDSEGSIHSIVPPLTGPGDSFAALDCQSSQADSYRHALAEEVGKLPMCAENNTVHSEVSSPQGLPVVVLKVDIVDGEPKPSASGLYGNHGDKDEWAHTESVHIEGHAPLSTKALAPRTLNPREVSVASESAHTTTILWQPPHSSLAWQDASTPSHITGSPIVCSPHTAVDTVEENSAVSESTHSVLVVQRTTVVQV